jgi:hypothetical protein
MGAHVIEGSSEHFLVFVEHPERTVAGETKQPTHSAALVLVVNMQTLAISGWTTADGAPPTLRFEQLRVVVERDSEPTLQMLFAISARITNPTLSRGDDAIGILALPLLDSVDDVFPILLVPTGGARFEARLAVSAQPIARRGGRIELSGRLGLSALRTRLHLQNISPGVTLMHETRTRSIDRPFVHSFLRTPRRSPRAPRRFRPRDRRART